jgi:8-oxo-dGTP diphosphatase
MSRDAPLPYRIAVLCYLYDAQGRVLLLHRAKAPNFELYSPIGGKLEQADGESPSACAIREIHEEAGLVIQPEDIHLVGVISERAYEDSGHWLLFCFEVTHPVEVAEGAHDEGRLEWHPLDRVFDLNIPESDRQIIWPIFLRHRGGGFFMVHIECEDGRLNWTLDESRLPQAGLPFARQSDC